MGKYILYQDGYNNRRGIPVIPFARYADTVERPKKPDYPYHPVSVGDHIKKRRMDLSILQKDVADQFGISLCTISNWENNEGEPQVNYFPAIIAFLGFLPLSIDTSTLGGRIKLHRYQQGLNHEDMGKLLGVDGTTVGGWERNEHVPHPKLLRVLNKYLNQNKGDYIL